MPERPPRAPEPIDPAHRERMRVLKEYADSLPQPIFEVGPDLRLRFANTAALEAFGYTEEELGAGFFVLDMLEPNEQDIGAARVHQMFSGQALPPREYVARRKDGSTFPALIFSRAIFEHGVPAGLRGIVEDITERKRADEALEAHSRRRATAARLAQVALETTNIDALLQQVVAQVADTLAVDFAKVLEYRSARRDFRLRAGVGWQPGLVGHATAPDGLESQAGFTLASNAPVVVTDFARETRFTSPDLLRAHGVASGISVTIKVNGRPWGVLGAHATSPREFTADEGHFAVAVATLIASALERIALEEQLIVSQKMEAVGQMAGSVAHGFNNMLTVIRGCADLILLDDTLERARENGRQIRDAALRATALTRQLLSVSRRQVVLPRTLDLRTVLEGLDEMLARLIGEDIQLTVQVAPDLGLVRADPGQLEQVILNLVVNARDAMPGGGRLHLALDNVEAADVNDLPPGVSGPLVRLAITDSGHGMDEDTRGRIFEPFFTTKEKGKGTGLGLSTTCEIVQQNGGHITAWSEPARGSTFSVVLPQVLEPPAAGPVSADAQAAGVVAMTVLLVEDEENVRGVARSMLRLGGHQVLEAENVREALDVSRRHPDRIDLLLTDVIMPGGSGRELADLLRKERPQLRVLFMSGYTDEALSAHNVLSAGTAFIQKPFDSGQLAQALREALEGEPPAG